MASYLSQVAAEFGVSLWLLMVIIAWSLFWKLVAFWKSARNNHPIWFVAFAIFNTIGILEILYIFVFSKMKYEETPVIKEEPIKTRKKVSRKKSK